MRVVLSTWGRFHVFHLARQMLRFGWLERVFVTYPRWKLRDEGIPDDKLFTNPWLHTAVMAKWRVGLYNAGLDRQLLRWVDRNQHRFILRHMPECDIFVALSGSGLAGGRLVQSRGGRWICNRSASHMQYADNLLREEFARFGAPYPGADPWAIEKELKEYEESDLIVVPSDFARDSFIEMGVDPAKVRRISFGGDLKTFRRTQDPDPEKFTIFYCGQVSFRKGIPYLIEAFRRLKHPNKELVIAGGVLPEIRPYLASHDLEGVRFMGHVHRDQLSELYSQADVFAFASLEEGMAKVQTEAMSCGVPVVVTPNAGGTDVIREGVDGYIVPIRDPAAMADRLQRLADDRDLARRMGASGIERIRSFGGGGWDRYGDAYREMCLSLTGRPAEEPSPLPREATNGRGRR